MRVLWILLIAAAGICFVVSGCEEETPTLGADHAGFGDPKCKECHTDAHHWELDPYECADCHGINGASARPADHAETGCDTCHPTSHGEDGFPVPNSCLFCHE